MVVTRRGEHKLADPNLARGAGRDSLHSPMRGLLDYANPLAAVDDTVQQAGGMLLERIEDVVAFIKATTGIDLSGPAALLTLPLNVLGGAELGKVMQVLGMFIPSLANDATDPGSFDLQAAAVEFIETVLNPTGLIGGLLSVAEKLTGILNPADPDAALAQWGTNLRTLFGGTNLNQAGLTQSTGLTQWIQNGVLPLNLLLGPSSPLRAGNLFGALQPSLIREVPLTSIGDRTDNLLDDPQFQNANAFVGIPRVAHDPTRGRTSLGCAVLTPAGVLTDIYTDPAIPVSAGQTIAASIYARVDGVTSSGTPIQLGIAAYSDVDGTVHNPAASAIIAQAAGAGTSAGLTFPILLSGGYTVPAGVASVRLRPLATGLVTAGTVAFDDADLHKTQSLPGGKVSGGLGLASIIEELRKHNDDVTNALSGNSVTGSELVGALLPDSKGVMSKLYEMLTKVTADVQAIQEERMSASAGGRAFSINFGQYPDGPFPAGLFNISSTGAGTSSLAIADGKAVINMVNNGDKVFTLIYPTPLLTDYAIVRGTMSSPPEQASGGGQRPEIWAIARSNAAGTEFVWARGYCTGWLTYKGDIGCINASGVQVWATNVSLTWSLDMYLVCGLGNDPRHHQVVSGSTIVWDNYEPGHPLSTLGGSAAQQSLIDANHRYWGSRSATNGRQTPGAIAAARVRDNAPPSLVGTVFRASRRVGADVTIPADGAPVPHNFYPVVDFITEDVTYTPGDNCKLTVSKAGTYLVIWRVYHGQFATGTKGEGLLYRSVAGGGFSRYGLTSVSECPFNVGYGVMATPADSSFGAQIVPLAAGDSIKPGFRFTNSMTNTGDTSILADGAETYFSVARLGV